MAKKAKKSTKKKVVDEEKAAAWEKIKAQHMEHIGISDKNEEAADYEPKLKKGQ
jgi:hypothetical protein